MRVALFGGSFDPPHVAHQLACLYALATQDIDQVWMVPCFQHAFDKRSAPFGHRVALCRLAAAAIPRVQVCTIEEELGGPSYTLVTVRALQARHPEHDFQIMIGADLLKERERWHGWDELSRLVPFLVLGRAGSGAEAPAVVDREARGAAVVDREARSAAVVDQVVLPAVSSTRVRALLKAGQRPTGLVAREVLDYIEEHRLYRA